MLNSGHKVVVIHIDEEMEDISGEEVVEGIKVYYFPKLSAGTLTAVKKLAENGMW
jgi:hypothetical protein